MKKHAGPLLQDYPHAHRRDVEKEDDQAYPGKLIMDEHVHKYIERFRVVDRDGTKLGCKMGFPHSPRRRNRPRSHRRDVGVGGG